MHIFYVLPQDIQEDSVLFRSDEAKHLCSVLRKGVGEMVSAVDGQGNEFDILLERVSAHSAGGRILRRRRKSREPIVQIALAQALPKGARMDQIIQKGTELGVYRFLPMITEHTVISLDMHAAEKKRKRWGKIAVSAMKQSLRSHLPKVEAPVSLVEVMQEAGQYDLSLMATVVKDTPGLHRVLAAAGLPRRVLLLVGPEGGFSDQEIHQAREHGFHLVSLGPRRLRSETAAILLVGLVLFQFKEMG